MDEIDDTTLQALLSDLGEVELQLAQLEAEKSQLRERIGLAVALRGGSVVVPGVLQAKITSPSIVRTYDRAGVEQVLADLQTAGEAQWAARLAACRKESERAGGLYIKRDKPAEPR